MIKQLTILAILFFTVANQNISLCQNVTKHPKVERHNDWSSGENPIVEVNVSDEYTIVFFDYITPRNMKDSWLSLSSKTTISSKSPKMSYSIVSWGILLDNPETLDFDKQYDVMADRRYRLYMIFPPIPSGIEKVTIHENVGKNSFFWTGIIINNPLINKTENYQNRSNVKTEEEIIDVKSSGSGFAISSRGLIVTSYHVVKDATRIQVRGVNGNFDVAYKAKILTFDRINDIAILEISDPLFTNLAEIPYQVSFNISDVGDDVFVLGYPLRALMGDEIKLTNGLISSRSGFQGDITSYQVSAPVQPGNSGGPLFNKDGDVIGIINARLSIESVSYAVKTPYLKTMLDSYGNNNNLPTINLIRNLTLSDKVKAIRNFVYIIETN
jgi:S1-C subfamily serine protease